jgi:hypothetical protein
MLFFILSPFIAMSDAVKVAAMLWCVQQFVMSWYISMQLAGGCWH